jgi:hypothetical protein
MDLSNILSITGKGSLYKLISRAPNNFIVESLEDGHRFPAFSHDGVATLDNIAIFTEEEEVTLQSVFQSIYKKENGQKVAVPKDNNALKAYFAEVLPNYDRDRVYVSNIKKVLAWYNILVEHNLVDLEEEKGGETAEEAAEKE